MHCLLEPPWPGKAEVLEPAWEQPSPSAATDPQAFPGSLGQCLGACKFKGSAEIESLDGWSSKH